MAFCRQFALLLWKNWLLQSRKKCVTVFEILLPIFFAAIVIAVRSSSKVSNVSNSTLYDPKIMDGDVPGMYNNRSTVDILYAPNDPIIRRLMESAVGKLKHRVYEFNGIPFANEAELLKYFGRLEDSSGVLMGVVIEGKFDDTSSLPEHLTVKLRPISDQSSPWNTDGQFDFGTGTRPSRKIPPYYKSGFMAVQYAVTSAIIEQTNTTVNVTNDVTLSVEQMAYPPYFEDSFGSTFAIIGPLMTMLAMILSVLQMTKDIVYEKERKLKESMKMMGLTNATHWTAWFFKCFTVLTVIMAIFTGFFSIPVTADGRSIISASDKSVFFVFLLCYAVTIIAYCFLMSTCFNNANGAAAVSAILFVLCYGPYFAVEGQYSQMTFSQKMASCLLFNVDMGIGLKIFASADSSGKGVHWSDIADPVAPDDDMSILLIIIMLLVDAIIYLLITWYIDAVFPGEYGVPQPWYFPVTRTYWCGSRPKMSELDPEWNHSAGGDRETYFEKDPAGLAKGISICNLRKEFKTRHKEPKVAVNGTNFNVYKGQITALLGHNGAGKTTTMSMLTGFLPATSGTAFVNGYDVSRDISSVRKSLGLCPQHDILFDSLTVTEHLTFFALLKGCPWGDVSKEVANMIRVVGLAGKENAYSRTLSGGQKRKLSIGIALIGGSQTVILDEPTSGMDPQARTQIWRILQEHKANRTILFTTHFMDEADILGDRIAIMADGVVKCCGTPLFLKRKYGSGYQLTIVKGSKTCDIPKICQLIKSHVTTAVPKSNVGSELTFSLPSSESPKFEALFKDLEDQSSSLDISSFGASVTTMEEVFLRAGQTSETAGFLENGLSSHALLTSEMLNGSSHQSAEFLALNQRETKNTGLALTLQQFRAGLTKKMLHTWRNRVVTLAQLILPVAFTAAGLAVSIATVPRDTGPQPALTLNMAPFQDNIVAYSYRGKETSDTNITELFARQLENTASELKFVDLKAFENNMSKFYEDVGLDVGVALYNRQYLIGAMFEDVGTQSNKTVGITGYYNGQPYHSQGIVMAYMMNTLLKYYVNPSADVSMVNHPLPETTTSVHGSVSPSAFSLSFFILFGMGFMTSCYAIFLIKERVSQAKQIQTVSGLRPVTFWLTHWIWDFVSYMLPCMGVLIVFAAFQTPEFAGQRLGYLLVILLVFGWAILPQVYMLSFFFKTPPGGMVALVMISCLTGFIFLMVVFIISLQGTSTMAATDVLKWIFGSIFPNYCLGQSIMDFYDNYHGLKSCGMLDVHSLCIGNSSQFNHACCTAQENYFSLPYPGVGRFMALMGIQGVLYFTMVLLLEYGVFRKLCYLLRDSPQYPPDIRLVPEDEDVAEERTRINASNPQGQTDSLILYNITKFYDSHLAVNRLCLGVPQNECFGLLGVNGAGKTSTFKMLTGEEVISDGNAYINRHNVQQNMQQVHQSIGYCPQFDALIDQMTGRETLTMYARLRGIPESRIPEIVRLLMKTLWFDEHADKEARQYSGGTKRKLSTAIALIGDSPVIFLDEPTTGVDPVARRQLWNLLSQIRASGRTLILTSHSMEECDALCTRIAIMVNGQFLCLGSPQHLKNKFGQGYTFIARVASSNTEALERFIEQKFPRHQKMDSTIGYVSYQLLDPDLPLSYIFGSVETSRHELHLEDYSVSQTTLHQVFLDFTKHQTSAEGTTKTKRCCCCTCCCCCC